MHFQRREFRNFPPHEMPIITTTIRSVFKSLKLMPEKSRYHEFSPQADIPNVSPHS